jgi:hypothetical protein
MSLESWSCGRCKLAQPPLQAMKPCELKCLQNKLLKSQCHLQEKLKDILVNKNIHAHQNLSNKQTIGLKKAN